MTLILCLRLNGTTALLLSSAGWGEICHPSWHVTCSSGSCWRRCSCACSPQPNVVAVRHVHSCHARTRGMEECRHCMQRWGRVRILPTSSTVPVTSTHARVDPLVDPELTYEVGRVATGPCHRTPHVSGRRHTSPGDAKRRRRSPTLPSQSPTVAAAVAPPPQDTLTHYRVATHSISTFAFKGSVLTANVARAGGSFSKYLPARTSLRSSPGYACDGGACAPCACGGPAPRSRQMATAGVCGLSSRR